MNKNRFCISWRLILLTIFLIFIFSLLGAIPFMARHEYIASALGELSIFVPIVLGLRIFRNNNEAKKTLRTGFSPIFILPLFLLPICLQTYTTLFTFPLEALFDAIPWSHHPISVKTASGILEYIIRVLTICIIPAITEEFLCRGIILRMLKPYGLAAAILFSALAFAILHFSLYSFPAIFMLGILFAAIKLLTGSIWACIFAHFSNNLWAITLPLIKMPQIADAVVSGIFVILFPLLFVMLLKFTSYTPEKRAFPPRKTGFSPELAICLVLFTAILISH